MRRVILTCLFSFYSLSSLASLSLSEIERSIDLHYPLILSNLKELESAQAQVISAEGNFDINFSAQAGFKERTLGDQEVLSTTFGGKTKLMGLSWETGFSKGAGYFPSYEGERKTFQDGEWLAQVKMPLLKNFWIDKERMHLKKSKIEVAKTQQELKSQKLQVLLEGTVAYWNWVKACLKYKVYESLLSNALKREDNLASRFKNGDVSGILKLDNDRLILKRKSYLVSAEQEVTRAALILSLFSRDEQGQPKLIEPKDAPLNLEVKKYQDILNEITAKNFPIAEHPLVKKNENLLEKIKIEKDLAKNQILPQLDVKSEYNRSLGEARSNVSRDEFKTSIVFSIPLQNREAQGQHNSLKFQADKIYYEWQLVQEQLKVKQQNALLSLKMAYERQLLAKQELDLNKTLESAENRRLQMGDSDLVTVNIREESTAESESRFIEEQVEYQKSIGYLHYAYAIGI
ncbi:MAG: TolC family protein [Bacteriovoracaceae bacterium]|nr:TolC family protein [Bacteriovoracaceae bacterium]